MDRSDEKREERTDDRADITYNPLGIGDANPPRDHVPGDAEEETGVGDTATNTPRPGAREIRRSPGATSIDMGAGGTGTEIERP